MRVSTPALAVSSSLPRRHLRLGVWALALGAVALSWPSSSWARAKERAAGAIDGAEAARSARGPAALDGFFRAIEVHRSISDESTLDAFVDAVAGAAKSPEVRARALYAKARRLARQGAFDQAAAIDDRLGLLREAWVLGTLDASSPSGFANVTAFEAEPVALDASVAGKAHTVAWTRFSAEPRQGKLRLGTALSEGGDAQALVPVVVHSPRAQPAALRVGSSGPVFATLNGTRVLTDTRVRRYAFDQQAVGVTLVRGANLLVIRTVRQGGGFGLSVRLTRPDGAALPFRYGVAPADFSAARAHFQAGSRDGTGATGPAIVDSVAQAFAEAESGEPTLLLRAARIARATRIFDRRHAPSQAAVWIERALDAAPDAPLAVRAAAYARLGAAWRDADDNRARAAFEKSVAASDNLVARIALVRLAMDQNLRDEALDGLRALEQRFPADPRVLAVRIAFGERMGVRDVDVDARKLALEERRPTRATLRDAFEAAQRRGLEDRAQRIARRLLAFDAADRQVLAARIARARAELDGLDDSATEERAALGKSIIATLELWLRHYPADHGAARRLARALESFGETARARALVEARLSRFPARTEPLALAAEMALWRGERERAKSKLGQLLVLAPQDRQAARLLSLLRPGEDDLASRFGLALAPQAATPTPDEARAVGAFVESKVVAARVYENGLGTIVEDTIVQIVDGKKAAGLQTFRYPFSAGREVVEVLIAQRISHDGVRTKASDEVRAPQGKSGGVYSDTWERWVKFGPLHDGDRIQVRIKRDLVGRTNLFGDFFGLIQPIQSTFPIGRLRVVVEAPPSRPLYIGGRGLGTVRRSVHAGWQQLALVREHIPAIRPEPAMPPFFDVADYFSISTYESWAEMGAWYADMVAPQLKLNDALRAIADDVVKDAPDVRERVRRLYEWVITNTRYVGIELGIHGWKPYPVTEVARRAYGDCKDKASLLVALLGHVGVDARLTLLRTADIGALAPKPASMWAFNHAIAYVPALDLFLDATAERSGFDELPAADQGAMALIVPPAGSSETARLTKIPIKPAHTNLNQSAYTLRLDVDGGLHLSGTERFVGVDNADLRRDFDDVATRRTDLERRLNEVLPGIHITRLDVGDLGLDQPELQYTFDADIPNRASQVGRGVWSLPVSLYPHGLAASYAQTSRRRHAVWVRKPWQTRNVMRYVLPPGARVVDLPAGGRVDSPHLSFVQVITRTEDGFIVDETTTVKHRLIPPQDYAAFRRAALAADQRMRKTVRIAFAGGTP